MAERKKPDLALVRQQVEERVAREREQLAAGRRGKSDDGGEITSRFVMECLDAEELGDGLLYAALHHGKYVFAKNFETWYAWDGHSWRRDDMDTAVAAVEEVALRYAEEIAILGQQLAEAMADGSDAGKALQKAIRARMDQVSKRVLRLRRDTGRQGCLKFAHTNPARPLAVTGVEFDIDPWRLACPNGIINLQTGELEPGRPEDYISRRTNAEYHGLDAEAGPWSAALETIYSGDRDLIDYMQRLFGYGISGETVEHIFPVMHGAGRNGKSLIVEAIGYALGDYAGPVPAEMLLESSRSSSAASPTPEIMALKGLRIAFASETDEGRRFSAAKVKWLTGGDQLTGRGLHDKRLTTFDPTHLLVLLTNHKPSAPDGDFAFWERCFLIPHKRRFVSREPDPDKDNELPADKYLGHKLRECAPGILAWLVMGCLEWQRRGLDPPADIVTATSEYQADEGTMERFLEMATVAGPGLRISAAELYAGYEHWYRANVNKNAKYTPSQKRFGSAFMALERYARIKSGGTYHYLGLDLSDECRRQIEAAQAGNEGNRWWSGDDKG